jgi:hypothetical protein
VGKIERNGHLTSLTIPLFCYTHRKGGDFDAGSSNKLVKEAVSQHPLPLVRQFQQRCTKWLDDKNKKTDVLDDSKHRPASKILLLDAFFPLRWFLHLQQVTSI